MFDARTRKSRKSRVLLAAIFALLFAVVAFVCFVAPNIAKADQSSNKTVDSVFDAMTTDDKISQLIMLSARTWNNGETTQAVTDLNADQCKDLKTSLQQHQFNGLCLFGSNIKDTAQITKLNNDLQVNNLACEGTVKDAKVPYLLSVDQEGGAVVRLTSGTRMVGNMALTATGDNALSNTKAAAKVIANETKACLFNTNFAPDLDVNNNPANPVIGTRSFSDITAPVSTLGVEMGNTFMDQGVIPTYKHFPGHGDVAVDSHTNPYPHVDKTYEEIKQTELVPFQSAINSGADLIMTAHVIFPKVDSTTADDGECWPATMSPTILNKILREDMGYNGVVVTDALEMSAANRKFFSKDDDVKSAKYKCDQIKRVIESGADIALMPLEFGSKENVQITNDYIKLLCDEYENDATFKECVDKSVKRVLTLKNNHGILNSNPEEVIINKQIEEAQKTVGSTENHEVEFDIASQAITLLKNDNNTVLPLSGHNTNTVILGTSADDSVAFNYVVTQLKEQGIIDSNAYINNLIDPTKSSGDPNSSTRITLDYYVQKASSGTGNVPKISSALKAEIARANNVVCLSRTKTLTDMSDTDAKSAALDQISTLTHDVGGKFILLSGTLPYDITRYPYADAAVVAYLASGTGTDPTHESGSQSAVCANVMCALATIFDSNQPKGKLPVDIPSLTKVSDTEYEYTKEILYPRTTGLSYNYQFVQGSDPSWKVGEAKDTTLRTNARVDKLTSVKVDGKTLDKSNYSLTPGSTVITLKSDYLNSLDEGMHTLALTYNYDGDVHACKTSLTAYTNASGGKDKNAADTDNSLGTKTSKTGDFPWLALAAVIVAVAAVVSAVCIRRRMRK